ncbi:MAG: HTTM domain-containing protein [Bdellovibrionaceae bacterium]|nr:HTTM domain-containing protein [Pseudobdellovibrionaceae bacterium]
MKQLNILSQFDQLLLKKRPSSLLGLFRILYCGGLLYELPSFFRSIPPQMEAYTCTPVGILQFLYFSPSQSSIPVFRTIAVITLVCSMIGFLTRLSLTISLLLLTVLIGTSVACTLAASQTVELIPWNFSIVLFNLFILILSPGVNALSLDSVLKLKTVPVHIPNWPIWLLKFNLAFSYFSGGIVKIRSGLEWMNGYTLQFYLIYRDILFDIPIGRWVSEQYPILLFICISTVIFELLFPLVLFSRTAALIMLPLTFLMQVLFYLFVDLRWMDFYGWAYLIYFVEIVYFLKCYALSTSKAFAVDPTNSTS